MIVVDASVALAWCFEDELSDYAEKVLATVNEDGAVVPEIWPLEVANGLLLAERRERFTHSDTVRGVELLLDLNVEVEEPHISSVLATVLPLARSQGLSAYDAAYIAIAERRRLGLATLDRRLRQVAEAVGVPLVE